MKRYAIAALALSVLPALLPVPSHAASQTIRVGVSSGAQAEIMLDQMRDRQFEAREPAFAGAILRFEKMHAIPRAFDARESLVRPGIDIGMKRHAESMQRGLRIALPDRAPHDFARDVTIGPANRLFLQSFANPSRQKMEWRPHEPILVVLGIDVIE